MSINCFVFLSCSQLNQKLKELTEGSQNDSSQAITEPQPVQPSVSIALHSVFQCISLFLHIIISKDT